MLIETFTGYHKQMSSLWLEVEKLKMNEIVKQQTIKI